jgi:hypothetical protein
VSGRPWLSAGFTTTLLALATVRALAQSAGPATDALLSRAERGDPAAGHEAEALGWRFIKQVADNGRLDAVTARAMARTALFLEGPLPATDAAPTPKERVWRSAAVNALEMALAQDSGDVWSASQLERIAPYPFIWMGPDKELAALRALLARHADLASQLQLTRVRLELERGSPDSAAAWLATLPLDAASPAARGHLAAEVAFAQRHDSIGATEYYDGAAAIHDSADAAWYTRDLLWIAQPDELDDWKALAPGARDAWLEKFWNRRDIDDGQLPGTRLPEQFRRWRVALRNYRWEYDGSTARGMIIPLNDGVEYRDGPRGDPASGDIPFPRDPTVSELAYLNRMRPLTKVLDDRGGLVLRHGEPSQRVNMPGVTKLQEETLLWRTQSEPLIVSFSRMAERIPPPLGKLIPSLRYGMVARNYPTGDLTANCEVYPQLCGIAAKIVIDLLHKPPVLSTATLADAALVFRDFTRMRTEAEHTDGNPETFTNDLHAIVQAYGIPDEGLLVVFAIPARDLVPDAKQRTVTTTFGARLRIVAGDSARGEFAAALDTTRNWTFAAPPEDKTYLTGYVVVPAGTGTWSVAVILSDLARRGGSGERIRDVPVVAFDGSTLRLGDPILGSNESGLAWNHDGNHVPLNPRNAWRPDELAVLSYQVDGLIRGRTYETRIEIWQGASLKHSLVAATVAASEAMTAQKELSLRELAMGDYRIVLRIRDTVTGAEVSRERKLAVRN